MFKAIFFRPWVIHFSVIALCAWGTLEVKYQVKTMQESVYQLREKIAFERSSIHVLNAEWALLNTPSRIQKLAEKHLHLSPLKLAQVDKGILVANTKVARNNIKRVSTSAVRPMAGQTPTAQR